MKNNCLKNYMNIAAEAAQPRSVAGAPSLFGLHSRLSAGLKIKGGT